MDYIRYLRSKQTVDDRAINLRVLQDFEAHLLQHAATSKSRRLRMVEVGGGTGAMFMRLLSRNKLFHGHANIDYVIVDIDHDLLLEAQETILRNAPLVLNKEPVLPPHSEPVQPRCKKLVSPDIVQPNGAHRAGKGGCQPVELCRIALTEYITVALVLGDAIVYLAQRTGSFDVVIGAAVMDLWEMEHALKVFLAALSTESGLAAFYFPINFDGTTDFFPESSEGHEFDLHIESEFHRAMGSRKLMGRQVTAAHTGRRLLPCLRKLGARIKSTGGSTWIVSADDKCHYPADEAFFLHCIVDFIEASSPHFEGSLLASDPSALARCMRSRRRQIAEGNLVYTAHNIDVFGVH